MASPATKSTALWVVRQLRLAGHQALFAGGCVRDMLLELRSSDYDVATDATPQQVKKLFRHVLLVGAKFGVAMVIHRHRKVEVTTFRSDLSYSDGRRPDAVRFATPREDALRRDFTINGMFYDPIEEKVVDFVGGQKDLQRGVIRTIGDPQDRFAEDYLRMIRAVRFAVRLNFRIEQTTKAAVRKHAHHVTSISGERIFDELSKMLSRRSAARALRLMDDLDLAEAVLPDLRAAGMWGRSVGRVHAVAKRKDLPLALGALLVELPPRTIARTVRQWGASNELRDALVWMAEHLGDWKR
ncbi:MAG TPA: CCA tRNA nucleotidyltransferase, partial [Phycisphaerae bacterium]|nr:CCA tRNA nucleotidyltransferase [Phycisphaerae bacterium]